VTGSARVLLRVCGLRTEEQEDGEQKNDHQSMHPMIVLGRQADAPALLKSFEALFNALRLTVGGIPKEFDWF
jgi:hypothetical protein